VNVSAAKINYSSILSKAQKKKQAKTQEVSFASLIQNTSVPGATAFKTYDLTSSATQDQNLNSLKFGSNQTYGYSVDNLGYMGSDFNKAAGLPENFKIHKSSIDEIVRFNNKTYLFTPSPDQKPFENIDVADTVKQYYKLFNAVVPEGKETYSQSDLEKLPKGFSVNINQKPFGKSNFLKDVSLFAVSNVYSTQTQLQNAGELSSDIKKYGVSLSVYPLNFSTPNSSNSQEKDGFSFNPDTSVYEKEGGYAREGVFMQFLKGFPPIASDSGETRLTDQVQTYAQDMRSQSFDDMPITISDFLKNTKIIKEFLKKIIEDGLMSLSGNETADSIVDKLALRLEAFQKETVRPKGETNI